MRYTAEEDYRRARVSQSSKRRERRERRERRDWKGCNGHKGYCVSDALEVSLASRRTRITAELVFRRVATAEAYSAEAGASAAKAGNAETAEDGQLRLAICLPG